MLPSVFSFFTPTKILFGMGVSAKIGETIKTYQPRKILCVTGPHIAKSGVLDGIFRSLESAGLKYALFNDIEPNPSIETVDKGLAVLKQENCDFIVAVGGGSPMDTAKAIALMATNPGSIRDYWKNPPRHRALPVVAIPTTAGTASEVTFVTVIKDVERKVKMGIRTPLIAPVLAVCDPELTVSMPPDVTAATGMDALTHAIESYTNTVHNPVADVLALEAIALIIQNIRAAVARSNNMTARSNMLLGSLLAGMAFANTGLGVVHALTSPLGGYFPVLHGVANAILLPHCMAYNMMGAIDKFARMAHVMGEKVDHLTPLEAAEKAVAAVFKLNKDIGIPESLKVIGVTDDAFNPVAEEAYRNVNIPQNPRSVTVNDLAMILWRAF